MKIRVMSDLHLENIGYAPSFRPYIGEDVVVLAGDIGVNVYGVHWALRELKRCPVIYILGNHEYYHSHWESLAAEAQAVAAGSNVHVLECNWLKIGPITFLGCSLWTDFLAFGPELESECMNLAEATVSDFRRIVTGNERRQLRATDTQARCREHYRWLDHAIKSADGPVVVCTHHAPTLATNNPRYASELSNAYFHSAFDELIRPPVMAWIHGHTHWSGLQRVHNIPVLSNQGGYPGDKQMFSWDFMIEI